MALTALFLWLLFITRASSADIDRPSYKCAFFPQCPYSFSSHTQLGGHMRVHKHMGAPLPPQDAAEGDAGTYVALASLDALAFGPEAFVAAAPEGGGGGGSGEGGEFEGEAKEEVEKAEEV